MPHFPKPFFKKSRGLWYVEIDRQQINLGADVDEAHRRYHQLMVEPRPRPVSPTALVAVVDAFLDWVKAHRSPDTFEWYRYRLQRLCERHPELRAAELRPFHVQQWVDSYQLSRTSNRNYIRSIKRCCKWAVQQGYLDQNPIAHLEVPGADRREDIVTLGQYEQLLSCARDEAIRDLIVVTWETGCRPQESLRVEARHVDTERQRWVFRQQESKGKRAPRVVYLSDTAFEITKRRMRQFPEGPLFRNSTGRAWTPDAVNCAFDRARGKIVDERGLTQVVEPTEEEIVELLPRLLDTKTVRGERVPKTQSELRTEARRKLLARKVNKATPRYSLYALRHSWATRALQSGLDGLTVAILMGHSDPSTLARVYQHLAHQPEHLLAQARKAAGK